MANAAAVQLFFGNWAVGGNQFVLVAKFVLLFALIITSVRTTSDLRVVLWFLALSAAYIGYEVTINDRGQMDGSRLEGVGAAGEFLF